MVDSDRARRAVSRGPSAPRGSEATREALLAAGARLFAERGFDGTRVEAIARAAAVNPAMISYHFGGKRRLYVAILTATLTEVAERLRELPRGSAPPKEQLRRFIATFVDVMAERPFVPAIMAHEMMSGGRHVDRQLLPHLLAIFSVVREIVERGVRDGSFRQVHPALTHVGLVGSLIFFFITAPVRERLERAGKLPTDMPPAQAYVQHIQELMTRGLAAGRA